jgi:ferredoxin-type protein NapF
MAAGMLAAAAVFGRIFCGWACPVGFLADISDRIVRVFRRIKPQGRLGFLQYGLLAALLIFSLLSIDVLSPFDPMVILQRSLYVIWSMSGVPVILLLIVAGALLAPRLWCRICPMGAVLGLAAIASPFGRDVNDRCIKCMKCRRACPTGAISKENGFDTTACIKCLKCEKACPENAISFSLSKPALPSFEGRRTVLAAGAGLGLLAMAKVAVPRAEASYIRPPGSLAESRFNAACVRCESCVKACLGQVIRPAGLDAGLERAFTPVLDFNKGKCERCGTCGSVCPTGAVISIPEAKMKMGTARLDTKKCIAWAQDRKCLICAEVCPVKAIKGTGRNRPVVSEDVCVGCGSCQLNCPVEGKAIVVSSEGERRRDG